MPDNQAATSPFWAPHIHADRRPFLLARNRIVASLRAWFAAHDFVEVDTGALQVSPGNETHLHAFGTALKSPDGASSPLYLRTSPEFACKRLLAAGERRIVEFARAFRDRERGDLHHPEFTLVEWYRAHEPYQALMDDCAVILALAARATGAAQLSFRDCAIDPSAAPERLTVADAFARYAGIDLMAVLPPVEPSRFAAAAQAAGVTTVTLQVSNAADIAQAFASRERDDGIVVMSDPFLAVNSAVANDKALQFRVPVVSGISQGGSLIAYAPDTVDLFRRSATYVDRILRGASPADLLVQLPTKFELAINLKAAKALGVELPAILLARADEVIE